MGAADATLAEALAYFEGDWHGLAEDVLDSRCALWLGSAISANRFPNLGELLGIAFRRLHAEGDTTTIDHLVELAQADRPVAERVAIDSAVTFEDWPKTSRDVVVDGLWDHYATVLGTVASDGRRIKDWLDLPTIYADPSKQPDADHRFLALLIEEGAVVEMVSGNWDDLIERAHEACEPRRAVRPVVRGVELVDGVDQPTLFKFHGCARLAMADRAVHEPLMVATDDEIATFRDGAEARPVREALRTSIRRRPVLMVGLSAQDDDIQKTFALAAAGLEGAFSKPDATAGGPRPRLSVASDRLGCHQIELLETLHGAAFTAEPSRFTDRAAIPLYSKPFFGGLFVHLLLTKARLSIDHASPGGRSDVVRSLASIGLVQLRRWLCRRADTLDGADRWRQLAAELVVAVSRLVGLYRDQRAPSSGWEYISPWSGLTPRALRESPVLIWAVAYDRLLACLEILRRLGVRSGWSMRLLRADEPDRHATLETEECVRRVIVLLPNTGRDLLTQRGALVDGDDPDRVFLYAVGPRPAAQRRAPGSDLPRRRAEPVETGPIELWLEELLTDDLDQVANALAWEVA